MPYDMKKDRYPIPAYAGGPAGHSEVVAPNDTGELTTYYDYLWVGTAGNLTVTPVRNTGDAGILYSNVPIGWFPVAVRKVWATGTTAALIVGHWG